ncbi:uncharacterized protein sunn [Calliphora vicina]|uniref:uncharacterized protein sunn n=1 Tax=Calliphora vicina TaxID=7373 RepID=UPI00325C1CF8
MRFLTLLKSGVTVKNVALGFVQALLKESWQENELCLELTCDFINDTLAAIGLDCLITPEQIIAGGTYDWPLEQIQIYNFHHVEMDFKKLEEFLGELCYLVQLQHEIFINDLRELHEDDDLESPVEFLMQLIAVWCNVYKQLQKLEDMQANKRFEEPLSRINFHLLLGMHELRKMYRLDLHLLDAICTRLYWSALEGLYYKQTHEMIFTGLLDIFSKDYDLFYASSSQTINFFYEAFSVQINTLTPLKLYQTLGQMLLEENISTSKMNILINFLIEPSMLQVYFSTFLAKRYKWFNNITTKNLVKIQHEAVKFLNNLQSKLLTLDCFSREFMESVLNLIFKTQPITSNLVCHLYISMMKRKFSDQMILKHIMDFYVRHLGSIFQLSSYIHAMYEHFEFLLNFNIFLEIITDVNTAEIIRLLSAHILVIVFEIKVSEEAASTKQELQHLLQILPEIFENLHCQRTEGILLKVYSFIAIDKLKKPALDNFIHYAMGIFTHFANNLEYPLLMNIFNIFHNILNFNQEWQHLEQLSDHLLHTYHEMIRDLKRLEQTPEKLSNATLVNCNNLLKRFNIILKTKYDLLDNNYLDIIRTLSHYFLYNPEIQSLINKDNFFLDLYALEIIISCMFKLLKQQSDTNQNYTFFPEAQQLYKYLWLILKNQDELLMLPTVRIKTYFCSLLLLFTHLPFKFDSNVYRQLVQILIVVNFKNKTPSHKDGNESQQLHPLQCVEYQRVMLRQFTEMHKYQRVQIHTNMVWKLCIYYGMFKHTFQKELKDLLITLANYRLKIYKHIISVLIYNLYKQTPNLKHMTIVSILKQHKHLIDNNINVDSSPLLKVHVVLLVLQILEKALSVQRLKAGHNRLEALKHLNIFIEDLDLNQLQAKELMQQEVTKMTHHLITADERKYLDNFKLLLIE